MRILIAGDWHSELHEEAVYHALRRLGNEVARFSWHEYFHPRMGWLWAVDRVWKKAQNKFLAGPILARINRDFVARASEEKPDMVFVYRGTHISSCALRRVRRCVPGVVLTGYNNDDPFSRTHPWWLWRHFLAAIPEYDLMLAYRHANIEDFRAAGARRVELLRSWYVPQRNHPVILAPAEQEQYGCDVVFAGHYEPDGRLELLEDVLRQGFRLKLYGPPKYWNPVLRRSELLRSYVPVHQVWGAEYNKAIAGARVALCFLSKLNRDTYTRRCFEIPATGTMMIAEHTDDLAGLFREGVDAEFFRSAEELREKLVYYLRNDDARARIAASGRLRVQSEGHDVESRMRKMMDWVRELKAAN